MRDEHIQMTEMEYNLFKEKLYERLMEMLGTYLAIVCLSEVLAKFEIPKHLLLNAVKEAYPSEGSSNGNP